MGLCIFVILSLSLTATAIRVPVDSHEESDSQHPVVVEDTTENKPVYYISQEAEVDSYLVPPDPHKQEYQGDSQTPATYLLPPLPDSKSYYHGNPTEPGEQTDWQPVTQKPQLYKIKEAYQQTVAYTPGQEKGERFVLPIPSEQLEPPAVSAPDEYFVPPPGDNLELPLEDNVSVFSPPPSKSTPIYRPNKVLLQPVDPTLALHLTPPKYQKHIPTKIYPKKYNGAFRPVPIPIGQFVEKPFNGVPRAKPLKPFKPFLNPGNEYAPVPDEKKIYLYEQAEQKRKLSGDSTQAPQPIPLEDLNTNSEETSVEQEAAETNSRQPGSPAQRVPPRAAPGERTEFRMHGMKGPHSYQFGYDTGKGKNRQFRYEERDNDGHVKGHYGYMDRGGKLRVVNYDAHPELGFRAEAPKEEEP